MNNKKDILHSVSENLPYKSCLALILIIIPFVLNAITIKDGHNWGDDFAQYIICAQNIAFGRPYTDGIMLDLPVIFPPMYSIVLAPFVRIWGVNFIVLKSVNLIFLVFLAWGTYRLVKVNAGRSKGYWAALFVSWMSYLFVMKQNIISDLPFSAVAVWAVFYLERHAVRNREHDFWRAASLMAVSLLTRSAGAALFAGALCYLIFSGRKAARIKDVSVLAGFFVVTALAQNFFFGSTPGIWSVIIKYPLTVLGHVATNFGLATSGLLWALVPGSTGFSHVLYRVPSMFPIATVVAALFFLGLFIQLCYRRSLRPAFAVLSVYFALAILWTGTYYGPVESFARFTLPAVPLIMSEVMRAFERYRSKELHSVGRIILAIMFFLNVWNIVCLWDFNDDVTKNPEVSDMASWVKTHVKHGEAVLFIRPRFLSLMSGVTSAVIQDDDPKAVTEDWLKERSIRYAVVARNQGSPITKLIAAHPVMFQLVWNNRNFMVYKLVVNNFSDRTEYSHDEGGAPTVRNFMRDFKGSEVQ